MRVVARVWFVISTVMLPRSAKNKLFFFFVCVCVPSAIYCFYIVLGESSVISCSIESNYLDWFWCNKNVYDGAVLWGIQSENGGVLAKFCGDHTQEPCREYNHIYQGECG